MTAKEIITDYLRQHGYDGLFNPGVCGCTIEDLGCCECDCMSCQPGYQHADPTGEYDYIISAEPRRETLIGTDPENGQEITD